MSDARKTSRILIAEDSRTQAKRAQLVLEEAGFQVTIAVDGEAAWEALKQDTVDMVVSDIDMPRLDGFELCLRVKADPRLAQIPFVLLTGRMDLEALVRGLEVGADDVINKTWVPSLLVARLTALLRGRRPAAGGTGSRERLLELILSRTIELEEAFRALDEERRRRLESPPGLEPRFGVAGPPEVSGRSTETSGCRSQRTRWHRARSPERPTSCPHSTQPVAWRPRATSL